MQKAVKLEIYRNLYTSLCEEMGISLKRSSFSPNIKERGDFSCAVFNGSGEMISHAAHIPVHLGAMPLSIKYFLEEVELGDGDVGIVNDPFHGGTHLPDITLVKPVFHKGERVFFVGVRAHHADVGGMAPGSMPLAREIFQEGFIIPPMKIQKKGKLNEDLIKLFTANTRNPYERRGDLISQLYSLKKGEERLKNYISKYGDEFIEYGDYLIDYGERCMRSVIKGIPDGSYFFVDYLDDDGFGKEDIKIAVKIEVKGDEVSVDFTGTSEQVEGCVNAPISVTLSAVFYVFRSLIDEDIPLNHGIQRPIKVFAPPNTVVNASYPSSCAGGNVETSQRIVDVMLGALSKAIPDMIPAASYGTMSNVSFGDATFAYYETIAGGMGGSSRGDGESGIHAHMTNTRNTPIEALEIYYPVTIRSYRLRRGSGGRGKGRGGDGIIREFQFLRDVVVSVVSDRRKRGPYGLFGGECGKPGRNVKILSSAEYELPGKFTEVFRKGEILRVETPGGGGWGSLE